MASPRHLSRRFPETFGTLYIVTFSIVLGCYDCFGGGKIKDLSRALVLTLIHTLTLILTDDDDDHNVDE